MRMGIRPGVSTIGGVMKDLPDDWFRPGSHEQPDEDEQHASSEQGERNRYRRFSRRAKDLETHGRVHLDRDEQGGRSVVVGHRMDQASPSSATRAFRRGWMLWVLLALAVGVLVGTVVVRSSGIDSGAPDSVVSVPADNVTDAPAPYTGQSRPVTSITASATCTADPRGGIKGGLVTYQPANLVDGSSQTAWRCDGSANGQKITLKVPDGTSVVGVGLINGYAKKADGVDLYPQYRRVLKVRWDLPDGEWFIQDLTDDSQTFQTVMIAPTRVHGGIVMTIIDSTLPGEDMASRDAVLLSQVAVLTAK